MNKVSALLPIYPSMASFPACSQPPKTKKKPNKKTTLSSEGICKEIAGCQFNAGECVISVKTEAGVAFCVTLIIVF